MNETDLLAFGFVMDPEAKFKNGVLTITIPKAEEARPKTIKVQSEGK